MAPAAALLSIGLASAFQIGAGSAARSAANDRARAIEKIGHVEAAEARREGRKLRGAQRAAFAKSGIDPGFGAPLSVQVEAANESELAALRRQFRFDLQAADIKEQGKASFFKGLTGGVTTLLGGAGQAQQEGIFSMTNKQLFGRT